MNPDLTPTWCQLAAQASIEKDPQRLTYLVSEINRILMEAENSREVSTKSDLRNQLFSPAQR